MLLVILFSLLISFIYSSPVLNKTSSPPLLLLISFDGFRWDYPDIYKLSHFNSILERGVRVKYIDNSFATVTFPSHFTIVTGLFEETHGIVANKMYDPVLNAVATLDTINDTKWWSQNPYTQPIWISNQLANDSTQRRSGAIAWPGVTTSINGHLPSKYQAFNLNRTFDSVLKQVFKWFREPTETRINFGAVYHSQPDINGHKYGPISSEMNEILQVCDDYVKQLLQTIDNDEYLKTNLNVIITSDHGMHEIDRTHKIILDQYIDKSLFSAYGAYSFTNIFVKNASDIDRLYANLSVIPNYEVYKKSQIPDEYHYKLNVRIGDILMIGKVGYEIVVPGADPFRDSLGDHGFDNRVESMHPIFYAFGPAFRRNILAEPFRNVDIYPLMSHILHLKQRQTNGSLDNVKHILIDFPENIYFNAINYLISKTINALASSNLIVVICIILVILLSVVFIITACRHSRQLVYVETHNVPVHYHLLSTNEGSTNNLIVSESEDEEDKI